MDLPHKAEHSLADPEEHARQQLLRASLGANRCSARPGISTMNRSGHDQAKRKHDRAKRITGMSKAPVAA
jgi:hypothetical protein